MAINELKYEYDLAQRAKRRAEEQAALPPVAQTGRPYDALQNLRKPTMDLVNSSFGDASKFRFDTASGGGNSFNFAKDRVDSAEAKPEAAPMQRRLNAQRVDASEASTPFIPTQSVSGNTRAAEEERKQRLGDIDSALFSLRGNLNMRSKRDMFMGLMGMRNDLTKQAYDTQNDRDVAGARMANDAAQAAASLGEQAARRRDAANQFNAESQMGADRFELDREDKRAALESDERIAGARLLAADRAARRSQGIEAQKYMDQRADARYKQLRDDGLDDTAARTQVAEDFLTTGTNPDRSFYGALGMQDINDKISGDINKGTSWYDRWAYGSGATPFTDGRVDPLSFDIGSQDVTVGPAGGLGGFDRLFGGGYQISVPSEKPGMFTGQYLNEDEADRLNRLQRRRNEAR